MPVDEKPRIEYVEKDEMETYGKFVVEPLERGYGTTLGNSLRRVLLSSLVGAAVTSVRIEGILHEFSTIPGVLEDTTDIILNIKGLALKMYGDEPQIIRMESEGKGNVTAKNIIAGSDIEILNPDLHIATLEDDGRLFMEMTVEKGRGYVSAEKNKKEEQVIGDIPIDSIFSPIYKVNYHVEDTRVGQQTDYDRLILEVWGNGAIPPDEAVGQAAKIVKKYLQLFVDLTEMPEEEEPEPEEEDEEENRNLEMPIEEMELSVRSYNCLKRAGINSVEDLTQRTVEEMMKVRNLGKKSLEEVEKKLYELGLALKTNEE
ncbi:MAG: DNA-directed RNA polymerase subunit alpha [Syntrophaceticus sp.]|nr:DNA-directed RNA polymerase subunit alpha [Syntrophaceticus sp.]MDD4782186.1 DNA-directed RNA polymerase subunit alpha [Syntrophaceticus sp.]